MKSRLMKVPEAAALMNVSEKTTWNLLRDGALPRVKVRNCTRIPAAAVLDYLTGDGGVQ